MPLALLHTITRFLKPRWEKEAVESEGEKPDLSLAINNVPRITASARSFRSGSDGSKWLYGLSNTGSSPILDHRLLRQNARSAYHETPQARAIVERYSDTVVDTGLLLDSMPSFAVLGIEQEQAENWARNTEAAFHAWANSKKASRNETLTFYQLQRLAFTGQQRDGEYFVRFSYSPRSDLLNPLQLQLIDPNQISKDYFDTYTSTYGYQDVKDGIERNADGKEIAYYVNVKQKDGFFKSVRIPAFGSKSARRFMIHGFMPEYAGQGRGYSRLSHAIQDFENLTDFTAAQIKKAIIQSCINMYVKPSKDAPASQPFEGITHAGPAGPALPAGIVESELPESELGEAVNYVPIPEATFTQPGSVGVFNLQEGEDLSPFPSSAPSDSFAAFVGAFTSYISASMSIPVEVLQMKFEQNYSASRGALVLFWRVAQIWIAEVASDLLNPVYESWLDGEIAAGRIMAPGWSDPRLRAAWLSCSWIGAPMPNIDPMRTAKADKTYVELGAQTLDRVARNLNGSNGSSNRAKLSREFAELPATPWQQEGA